MRQPGRGLAVVGRYAARVIATVEEAAGDAITSSGKLRTLCSIYRQALTDSDRICLCAMLGAESCGLPDKLATAVAAFFQTNVDWIVNALPKDMPLKARRKRAAHILATLQGAMIVAGPEGFEKSQYRKFNIKWDETEPGDDYAMMQEVLTRRFSRLMKDEEKGSGNRPDLVLIDGGRGQLSSVTEVMDELGLADIPLVAIAKGPDRDAGRETFFMRGRPAMKLEPGSPVLYYLQRLRDESHRFVIGGHRARRKSAASQNPLDEIPGVGGSRKKALLAQFGSARGVSRAALADLEKTPGVSTALARKIYDWFRE